MSINAVRSLCELSLNNITPVANENHIDNAVSNKFNNHITITAQDCNVKYGVENPYDAASTSDTFNIKIGNTSRDVPQDDAYDETTSLIYALTLIIKSIPTAVRVKDKYVLTQQQLQRVIKLLINAVNVEVIINTDIDVGCCGCNSNKHRATHTVQDVYITCKDDDEKADNVIKSINTIPIIAKTLGDLNVSVREVTIA